MKATKLFLALLAGACVFVSAAARADVPSYVVVDPVDPSATLFIRLPTTLSPADLQRRKEALAKHEGAHLVAWEDFKAEPAQHIRSHIRRNDYPEVDVVRGLTQLLERYDGSPFGLTWNGGLAITGGDYRYAARTYAAYALDPASIARDADTRKDPLHPGHHLEPLLGR